jgi:hypothetical protein
MESTGVETFFALGKSLLRQAEAGEGQILAGLSRTTVQKLCFVLPTTSIIRALLA